ncbi:hypothetical protein AB0E44_05375 [Micrococcus terreus]|uniref:hypothetical protein n=1 Tax=Micrococcus terreus TaxID=574650 RepID=UPI0033E7DA60
MGGEFSGEGLVVDVDHHLGSGSAGVGERAGLGHLQGRAQGGDDPIDLLTLTLFGPQHPRVEEPAINWVIFTLGALPCLISRSGGGGEVEQALTVL